MTVEQPFIVDWRDRSVAALLLALPLSLLAEWLVSSTHHRPLGAATFGSAVVLGLLTVSLVLVALRSAPAQARGDAHRRRPGNAAIALGAASLLVALARTVL